MKVILASTSPYRRELLNKMGIAFSCYAPQVNETRLDNESPEQLVSRLAQLKSSAVAQQLDTESALIIGSDQVASIDGKILGKPGYFENAHQQLIHCSGRTVIFYTGLCVINTQTNEIDVAVETFKVMFKTLTDRQINAYLKKEQPYDCAGSFKSEGLGICLFDQLSGRDPNTLIGLPLIKLNEMLLKQDFDVLQHQQ